MQKPTHVNELLDNYMEKLNMSVHQKLSAIQRALKAPKGQMNKFGGYKYRSCEDILEAVKPHLGDCTITIIDDIVQVGDRIYVKAVATFSDGEEVISTQAFARESEIKKGMDDSQITGSASSYARKYALNGLLLIDDTKDADAQDNRQEGDELARAILQNAVSINIIKTGIAEGDLSTAAEAWFELSDEAKTKLWKAPRDGGPFTTEERKVMNTKEFRQAHYGEAA